MNACYCTHSWADHMIGNDPCYRCFCRFYVEQERPWGEFAERVMILRGVWKRINSMRRLGKCRKLDKKELAYRKSKWVHVEWDETKKKYIKFKDE
jgi:hypothetical protein